MKQKTCYMTASRIKSIINKEIKVICIIVMNSWFCIGSEFNAQVEISNHLNSFEFKHKRITELLEEFYKSVTKELSLDFS